MVTEPTPPGTRVPASRAHSARRGAIAAAGIIAALGAHVAASGGLDLLPIAPALWVMMIGIVALLGTRARAFSPRTWPVTVALVVLSQAVVHVGMVETPWAFGLRIHHAEALVTPTSLFVHLCAAIVLVCAVRHLDLVLASLCSVVAAVLRPQSSPPRVSRVTARIGVPSCTPRTAAIGLRRSPSLRGPPVAA